LRISGIAAALAVGLIISTAIAQIVISPPAADIHINGHTYTNSDWQNNPQGTLSAIANDVGAITQLYPQGRFSPRVVLSADLTMYVGGAGASDLNNCLVGSPCATIQRPFDLLRDRYDFAGHTVNVQLADGSYSPGVVLSGKMVGQINQYNLVLTGNPSNPSAVNVTDTRPISNFLDGGVGTPILVGYGAALGVRGMRVVSSFRSLWAHEGGKIIFNAIEFGQSGDGQITSDVGAEIRINGAYSVTGSAAYHYGAFNGGVIFTFEPAVPGSFTAVNIVGNPTIPVFAFATSLSQILAPASRMSFSGSINGIRYGIDGVSLIDTAGSGQNFFPGSCPCTVTNGSVYK